MREAATVWAATILLLYPDPLFACGDKFIFTGGGSRLERADAPVTPANILIYRDEATDSTSVMFDPGLSEALKEAGHAPSPVDGKEGLMRSAAEADIVLVEYRSARAVRDELRAKAAKAVVVPVLDREARKELSAAKREFGVVLNVPASLNALLRAIDRAMSAR